MKNIFKDLQNLMNCLIYLTKNQKLSKNDLIVEIILDVSVSESEGCMGKLKTSLINFSFTSGFDPNIDLGVINLSFACESKDGFSIIQFK